MTPTLSATTSFLKKPQAISTSAAARAIDVPGARLLDLHQQVLARMIGPATRCGKNATNSAKSIGLRRARISPL